MDQSFIKVKEQEFFALSMVRQFLLFWETEPGQRSFLLQLGDQSGAVPKVVPLLLGLGNRPAPHQAFTQQRIQEIRNVEHSLFDRICLGYPYQLEFFLNVANLIDKELVNSLIRALNCVLDIRAELQLFGGFLEHKQLF